MEKRSSSVLTPNILSIEPLTGSSRKLTVAEIYVPPTIVVLGEVAATALGYTWSGNYDVEAAYWN